MLEQLRRNSRSFIIWILFAIIIAAFVFTFGSQSGLDLQGCDASANSTVMTVEEDAVSVHSLRFGIRWTQGGQPWSQRAQRVLDRLLEREILAQAAEDSGLRVTDEALGERIATGKMLVMGQLVDGKSAYFRDFKGEKIFDYEILERAVQQWSLPGTDQFLIEQRRELLAEMMRNELRGSGMASPDEARSRFEYDGTTATIHAVKFRPADYRRKLALGPKEVEGYLAEHGDEVKKKFDEDERLYKERGAEVRVRQIKFNRDRPAAKPPESIEAPPEGAKPEDSGLLAARDAKAKLDGGADFAQLASEVSQDTRSQAKGGDLGWKSLKAPAMGAKALGDALKTLEVGAVSDVIETPLGFYILRVEDKREGDLTYDQVKYEIAEKLASEYYSKEGARQAAEASLAQAQAGTKLDEIFKAPPPRPQGLPDGVSEEEYRRFLEQLQQNQPRPGNEQGSIIIESRDMPAEASWQGAEASGSADEPAPAGGGTGAGKGAGKGGGKGAGTGAGKGGGTGDGTGGGTGAGDGSEAEAGPDPAASIAEAVASKIPLSSPVELPRLQNLGPFTREPDGLIRGLGTSEELTKAIFETLKEGDLAPQVYEIGSEFVVVQVTGREDPKMEDYDDKRRDELMRQLSQERGFEAYNQWIKERCRSLVEATKVGINQALIQGLSEDRDQPFSYQPCINVGQSLYY